MACWLDALSTELHTLILLLLDSTQSLFALIQASPRLYAVFLASKEKILSASVRRQIHPEVLPIAVAVTNISHLPRGMDRTAVIDTLNDLHAKNKDDCMSRILPFSTSVHLCRLCRSIDFTILDFTRYVSTRTEEYGFSLAKDPNSDFLSSRLSLTETGRLQRAFFNIELYSQLFYTGPHGKGKFTALEQSSLFLARMPSWQIEELACIYDYLMARLSRIFDEVEDKFVTSVTGDSSKPSRVVTAEPETLTRVQQVDCTSEDGTDYDSDASSELLGPDRFDHEDVFFSSFTKSHEHDWYMEFMVSLGLTSLRDLFVMNDEQRTQVVRANGHSERDFLGKALLEKPRGSYMSAENTDGMEEIKVPYGQSLTFHGDKLNEPNLAWLWSFGFKQEYLFREAERSFLCSWGYVFWDNIRIQSSKILDVRYVQLHF